jgi:hypothetical protein
MRWRGIPSVGTNSGTRSSGAVIINLVLPILSFCPLLLGVSGCVKIDGGAIEASWVLRTFDGRAVGDDCGCSAPAITRIRFRAQPVDRDGHIVGPDVCAGGGCAFTCASQRGATPFFVPEGRYAISLAPLGADGAELTTGNGPGTVRVQAPILRDVTYGQPTQLEAFAVEVGCSEECDGKDVTRACEKD